MFGCGYYILSVVLILLIIFVQFVDHHHHIISTMYEYNKNVSEIDVFDV